MGHVFQVGLLVTLLTSPRASVAQRQMEDLGRGVVAVRENSTDVFISWRLLGLDPAGIRFNVYRSANGGAWTKLNGLPLSGGCNYTDSPANLAVPNAYRVVPVIGGVEQSPSAAWTLPANAEAGPLFRVPLQPPANHRAEKVWVGDLDGDGEYEFIVCWTGTMAGQTQKLQAYKRDGAFLWEVDFGPNSVDSDNIYVKSAVISVGQWDGVTVGDLDSDGRADVVVKSANGVTFGDGTTLSYGDDVTQFISILDGMTGAERARAELPNPWETAINRPLGTLFGIGYPDGEKPSLMIHAKNRNPSLSFNIIESAWDFRDGVLSNRWSIQWDGAVAPEAGHQMRVVDLDGDGKDELFPGVHAVDDDGTLLYDMGDWGVNHGDRWQVGDLDPNHPGQEIYGVQQNNSSGLREFTADAATGRFLWTNGVPGSVVDVGRGSATDLDPNYPGMEVWAFDGIHSVSGTLVSSNYPWPNLVVWWDGDLRGDNLNGEVVDKWNYTSQSSSRLVTCYHYGTTLNSRSICAFQGDIIGDWREEIVFDSDSHTELVVFTTTSMTTHRLYTLAQNPAYRNCLTTQGYRQQHIPDYFLGDGMSNPPTPNILCTPLSPLPATPDAPTGLSATTVSAVQIDLAWTDHSTNEEGFQIERSTNGVDFVQVWLAGANTTHYSDVGLTSATTYYYRVRAGNLGGQSVYTGIASATTPAAVVVTATLPGTSTNSAIAPTLATSGPFDMNGGNVVVLLVTSENSATSRTLGASFAGQPMTTGVSTNQANQWAGIFYLIDPVTTSGSFEITNDVNSGGLACSAIALGNVGSVADTDALANTVDSGEFNLINTTLTNGGFVLGAAVNNGYSSSRPGPAFVSGPADQILFPSTIVGSSGHLHNYGDLPAAGTHTNTYANINGSGARNAYVTLAFERAAAPSPIPPLISTVRLIGDSLVFAGTNGTSGAAYYVLSSTNLTLPLSNWTRLATNHFLGDGSFVFTNTVNAQELERFYMMQMP